MTEIEHLIKEYQDAKAAMLAKVKDALIPSFNKYFEKYPTLDSFAWNQYTPYFNDGDTCEFSVNPYVDINNIDEGDLESNSTEAEISNDIRQLIEQIPEELMLDIYGDHVKVTIHRNTFVQVDQYDHD